MPGSDSDRIASLSVVDAIAGYYAVKAIDALVVSGAMQALADGGTLKQIAAGFGFDEQALLSVLRYLEKTTDIIELRSHDSSHSATLSRKYRASEVEHLTNLYVGAFGPCCDRIAEILRGSAKCDLVDLRRHSLAFVSDGPPDPYLPRLLREIRVSRLLDIGCGGGDLLIHMASTDNGFTGVGVDSNREALERARGRCAASSELQSRIEWLECSVLELHRSLSPEVRDGLQALCLRSVLNSLFSDKSLVKVVGVLGYLKEMFPKRILIVADYFAKLREPSCPSGSYRRTLIHDFAQLASAQGLPPAEQSGWETLYSQAQVSLIQAFHYAGDGLDHFIHLLQL